MTEKKQDEIIWIAGLLFQHKESKILSILVGTINLERREGGFLDGHVIVINIT